MKLLTSILSIFLVSPVFAQTPLTEVRLNELKTSLVAEAMLKGCLDPLQAGAFVDALRGMGFGTDQIKLEIDRLSKAYFSILQAKELSSILSPSRAVYFENRFRSIQTKGEFNQEMNLLVSEIGNSPVTRLHEGKMLDFKDSILNVVQTPELLPKKQTRKPLFENIYFAWGYNRDYHTNSDAKFTTPDGTFTIHNAVGKDRPSPFDPKVYFNPASMSVPQYNMELGGMFNQKWGVELKQDHMKLVFDNTRPYEITGDYRHPVVVDNDHPTNEWDDRIPVDFSVAKAKKDATWLNFEHSDGYNYVSVGLVYNQNLVKTKNGFFSADLRTGLGGGPVIPKTKVMIEQDQRWNFHGLDNKFHIAGGGVHAEVKLRFTFWNKVFLQAATRGTYIKVKNALVDGSSARLEQIQPIGSIQVMGQAGYIHTLKPRKKQKFR